MQTLTVTVPQVLRGQLQAYQNDLGIEDPAAAIILALENHFQTWQPTTKNDPLPAMYDAEDGPCEVIDAFREH